MSARFDPRRRRIVQAFGAAGLLSGCCIAPVDRIGDAQCQEQVRTFLDGVPGAPIAIDAHCHIFNGHDVDVEGYIRYPIANDAKTTKEKELLETAAAPVAGLICAMAPSAAQEYDALCGKFGWPRLTSSIEAADTLYDLSVERRESRKRRFAEEFARQLRGTDFKARYEGFLVPGRERDHGFERRSSDPGGRDFTTQEILKIMDLDGDDGPRSLVTTLLEAGVDPRGVFRLAYRLSSYRFDNLLELMRKYGHTDSAPGVSVFLPALVEFNRWLVKDETGAVLEDQIKLMELINVMTGGRVLPIVAYNPWTDVVTDAHFKLVQDAVMNRGFIGVKIYPSAGFTPINNGPDTFCDNPPPAADLARFATALNGKLTRFWAWCTTEKVPVMMHTGFSRGRCLKSVQNTRPELWQQVVDVNYGVPLHLGHFGGDTEYANGDGHQWAKAYIALMGKPGGSNVYTDTGFWDSLLKGESGPQEFLQSIVRDTTGARRLMYGSDYQMLVYAAHWGHYPDAVSRMIDGAHLGKHTPVVRNAVFFENAVRLYGLHRDGKGRHRIKTFFDNQKKQYGGQVHMSNWFDRADSVSP